MTQRRPPEHGWGKGLLHSRNLLQSETQVSWLSVGWNRLHSSHFAQALSLRRRYCLGTLPETWYDWKTRQYYLKSLLQNHRGLPCLKGNGHCPTKGAELTAQMYTLIHQLLWMKGSGTSPCLSSKVHPSNAEERWGEEQEGPRANQWHRWVDMWVPLVKETRSSTPAESKALPACELCDLSSVCQVCELPTNGNDLLLMETVSRGLMALGI